MAHILCVDDEASMRELVVTILAQAGHNAEATDSINEALRRLNAQPVHATGLPDLIISDLWVGMGSSNMAESRTLAEAAASKSIPVVLLTGAPPSIWEGQDTSVYAAVIEKPFDIDVLERTVIEVLERREIQRSRHHTACGDRPN